MHLLPSCSNFLGLIYCPLRCTTLLSFFFFFFFNDTATTEIYTLSLHDALPICPALSGDLEWLRGIWPRVKKALEFAWIPGRSEEHTSELQSHLNLVCRLLLEKKKNSSDMSTLKHLLMDDEENNMTRYGLTPTTL